MRYLLFVVFISLTILAKAQAPNQKLSRDSVRYYQKELGNLLNNTFDSLKNSEKYKEITSKLNHGRRSKKVTVELMVNMGLYITDFKNLNSRLKSIGQQEIKSSVPSVGVSLAIGFPNLTYGCELSSYTLSNKTAIFKGIHDRFYIATNVFRKGKVALHPQVGISSSILNMFIPSHQSQPNFDNLFLTQPNTVQLTHMANYLDFAFGLKLKSSTKDPFYWQIFRIGYRYGLTEVAWTRKNDELLNAPKDRNNQIYFQFCLGFDK